VIEWFEFLGNDNMLGNGLMAGITDLSEVGRRRRKVYRFEVEPVLSIPGFGMET
jgi:hypothetical protein